MAIEQKTYGNLSITPDGRWQITNAQPHVCIKLKSIFTKIARTAIQPFYFDNLPETCADLLWFTQRYPLQITEHDLSILQAGNQTHVDTLNQYEQILFPDYKPQPVELNPGKQARNYQLQAHELIMRCKRILIGDDYGLGKTLLGILLAMQQQARPCAIVVETHMPPQWMEKIKEFTSLKVHAINKTKPYDLPQADVYVFKYTQLAGWTSIFETGFFKSCVFDEMQQLRRNQSEKYKAANVLSQMAHFVIGLTATPVFNYGIEMFNILDLLKPGCLGQRADFMREWSTSGYENGALKDPAALGTFLRDNFLFLRRTRADVGRQLPKVNTIIQTVDYNEAEVEKIEDLARQLAIKVTQGSFVERGLAARELDMLARQNTGVAKAPSVAAHVKMLLDAGEAVVLAGWHRDVYDIWLEQLADYNPLMYTGSESPSQKEKNKQAFIKGESKLLIISLRSGAGLDGLQRACSIIVFGELDWTKKPMDQLIARLDRDGQTHPVMAVFCVCDCGSDPPMIDLIGLKESQAHNIVDPLLPVPQQHTDESRMKLLAQQYLKKQNKQLDLEV